MLEKSNNGHKVPFLEYKTFNRITEDYWMSTSNLNHIENTFEIVKQMLKNTKPLTKFYEARYFSCFHSKVAN